MSPLTPVQIALGMTCALLASSIWCHFATHKGWPISSTHAIVGSVISIGLIFAGTHAVNWSKIVPIVISWVLSPALGGALAIAVYWLFVLPIYSSEQPMRQLRRAAPLITGIVFTSIGLAVFYKGFKNLNLDLQFHEALLLSLAIGLCAAVVMHLSLSRRKLSEGGTYLQRVKQTEPVFATLQIITACYMSFAHGANDVSHAAGPIATVLQVIRTGRVGDEVTVSPLLLAFGGIGIVIGLSTYGYKVMATIGKKITTITPSRGFAAEFGCATTVLIAAKLGIPISSSHTIVGAVVGVGLVRGLQSLDLRIIRDIGMSWVLTIPCAGLLTALLYFLLLPIFT
jgi:PiT family inorganic phosphate transporter